ncbi:hypothetical protein PENFLA_c066G10716 [Penicillium flavigenum]|uniref:Uncharacterized protein n=1 Tax=Penicillium flavigenum TaxID=254877 RepID=A0A1V6SEG8_9EURO|nr:hypothetical protein PENFLA_c066G10716 [Penicillium flavigenum]
MDAINNLPFTRSRGHSWSMFTFLASTFPSDQQGFDPMVERAEGSAWDEQSPDRIHYQIEWKGKLNRVVVKDTKQDLTQPPRSYWEQIKENPCNILRRKTARGRRVGLDDTDMVVLSVNSQQDIDKDYVNISSQA